MSGKTESGQFAGMQDQGSILAVCDWTLEYFNISDVVLLFIF